MHTLLLNADGTPVGLMPLSTITWQESIKYLVLEKADVLIYHEHWIVRSYKWQTAVPSVMMLHEYMKPKTTVRFSRANIWLRDNCTCQYCGQHVDRLAATIDHVIPMSKGGKSTWENCTTACGQCNSHKSDEIIGWKPKIKPYKPDFYELVNKRKSQPFNLKHNEWNQFLL